MIITYVELTPSCTSRDEHRVLPSMPMAETATGRGSALNCRMPKAKTDSYTLESVR